MATPFRGEPAPPNADIGGVAAWVMRQLANVASAFASPVVKDHGTQSANYTFDPSTADRHKLILGASITLTLSTVAIPDATKVRLRVTQDGTGSRAITWSANVVWLSGITPTLQTAAAAIDDFDFEFKSVPGGTSVWVGRQLGKNINANTTGNAATSTSTTGNAATADKVNHSLTAGTHLAGGPYDGSASVTLTTDGTAANTASTLVLRDANKRTALDGVQFPATQSASSDANCLDDYEEGTWTPSDQSGAALAFTTPSGTYTKIGRLVVASCQVQYPVTADVNTARVGGLPFTTPSTEEPLQGFVTYTTEATLANVKPEASTTRVSLYTNVGGTILNSAMSGDYVSFTAIYTV